MRKRQQWSQAVERLRDLAVSRGDGPHSAAEEYGEVYRGRRGAMVFDVVVSRQRKYHKVVLPRVEKWAAAGDPSLARLAQSQVQAEQFGLQRTEPVTLQTVAANLLAFCRDQAISEDEGCRAWADGVQGLEHAPKLDPIVGGVSGIGPALFAYMRMRCGSDALKPDLRVAGALRKLGFDVPGDEHSILVVARAAAAELGVSLLVLDQLLWGRDG
ncbi:hypothetical protein [Kribbella pratensis]|nr:hypothetical protein [Kribbella pratensis]